MEDTDYMMKQQDHDRELYEENEGRKILRKFLIADIKSKSQDEGYFTDYNDDNELDVFFLTLSPTKERLLKQALKQWEMMPEEQREDILEELRAEIEQEEKPTEVKIEPVKTISDTSNQYNTDFVSDKIDEFMSKYVEQRKRANKSPAQATIDAYNSSFREFLFIIGNKTKCCDLDKKLIKKYRDALWKLPKSFMKLSKFNGMTIEDLVALDLKDSEKKSASTINGSVMFVKKFLKWAGREEYIVKNLEGFFETIPETANPHEKRDLFSPDELKLLFNNEVYEKGKFKNPSRYWIPLIALLSGMRGKEIAQLYKDNIKKDEKTGIWYFDLVKNEKRKQSLKNKSARRKVPIHPQLIKLGFLSFVDEAKKNSMIFPDLYNEKGKHYKKFGNNFNRRDKSGWMVKCGVKWEGTSFHSFRHNVINQLERVDIPTRIIGFLVGHAQQGGLVANYIKPDDMKTLHKAVKSIKYPSIDWKKIEKRWG